MATEFEVGRVYRTENRRLYLCIDLPNTMLSAYAGKVNIYKPDGAMTVLSGLSVEDLCTVWEIDLDKLDNISRKYLYHDLKRDPTEAEGSYERMRRKAKEPGELPTLSLSPRPAGKEFTWQDI